MSELVIVAGQDIDVEKLTAAYTDIPDQIEVILPLGPGEAAKLLFRPIPRRAELDTIIREASSFYRGISKQSGVKTHPWHEFWPQSLQEYLDAKLLAELSVEPKLPIETTLKWNRNAAMVRSIMEQLETASKTVATQWLAALTEEKKSD
jgi:hypothetical protein